MTLRARSQQPRGKTSSRLRRITLVVGMLHVSASQQLALLRSSAGSSCCQHCVTTLVVVQERQHIVHRLAVRSRLQGAVRAFVGERGEQDDDGRPVCKAASHIVMHFANEDR